jgi:citrate synthase
MAQWAELINDPDHVVVRSRQIYVGDGPRDYVPIAERTDEGADETELRTPL